MVLPSLYYLYDFPPAALLQTATVPSFFLLFVTAIQGFIEIYISVVVTVIGLVYVYQISVRKFLLGITVVECLFVAVIIDDHPRLRNGGLYRRNQCFP